MNFQGKLSDNTGAPMPAGTYNMKFSIHSASTGGSSLWNETRSVYGGTGVTVTTGGLFSIQLGSVNSLNPAIFNNASSLYLEIELPTPGTAQCATNGCPSYTEGPMSPRNPISSSPLALNSDLLDGLDSTAFAAASGSANYIQNQSASPQTASFSIDGTGLIETSSTTAFKVQDTIGTAILNVDTTNGIVGIAGINLSSGTTQGIWKEQTIPSDDVTTVTFGEGLFVTLGFDTPYIYTSPDGVNWTPRTASAEDWNAITYANGTFVAIGDGAAMTSPDGITWTDHTLPSNYWYDLTYGNGLFVAVSDSPPYVVTSPDGETWTTQTAPTNSWYDVTFGDGTFVAVGNDSGNETMSSTDGVNWTVHSAAAAQLWSVTYGNGLFVAVESSYLASEVATSTDGETWTTHPLEGDWNGVNYANGMFYATQDTSPFIKTSLDGINWTSQYTPSGDWWGLAYGNGKLMSIGSGSGNLITSTVTPALTLAGGAQINGNQTVNGDASIAGNININGNLTTNGDTLLQTSANSSTAFQIQNSAGGSLFTANTQNNTLTLSGGAAWSAAASPVANFWSGAAYGGGKFVAVRESSPYIATSPDGETWTAQTAPAGPWSTVAYGAGTFVATAYFGTDRVMTSPDGVTWTLQTAPITAGSVRFVNGLFIATAGNVAMTSPDGVTWTERTVPAGQWTDVTYGDGKYIGVNNSGTTIMTSTDAVTWTSEDISIFGLTSITYGQGQFVATDYNQVATSPDGVTWTARTIPFSNLNDIEYANGMFVASGYGANSLLTSTDGVTWASQYAASSGFGDVTSSADTFVVVGSSPYVVVGHPNSTLSVNGGIRSNGTTSINTESATAFQVQNASGAVFTANTLANIVSVGSTAANSSATLFTLDNYDGGTDPTGGVDGAMYYNSTLNEFRCYVDGAWANCAGSGGGVALATGDTASRTGSPTAGALYYDTDTDQLLSYNGTKWVGSQKSAIMVAASNSSQAQKDAADYVATGSNDGSTINTALTAGSGGIVYLQSGTYTLGATSISVPNTTTLSGAGDGTVLTYPNSFGSGTTNYYAITNTDTVTGTGVTIRDIKINGNRANQSGGRFYGINISGIGSTTLTGASIERMTIQNLNGLFGAGSGIHITNTKNSTLSSNTLMGNSSGIRLDGSSSNTVTGNTVNGNDTGILLYTSTANTVSGNTANNNLGVGIFLDESPSNTITSNAASNNLTNGIYLYDSPQSNISSNTINNNSNQGIYLDGSSNSNISNNTISGNASFGIYSDASTSNNISSNRLENNTGSSTDSSISVNDSSNQIIGNKITDTAGTGYAINIFGGTNNYLEANSFSGTGATTINDAGTNTIFAGQMKSATSDFAFRVGTNSATALAIQNSSGTSILNVDSSTSTVTMTNATVAAGGTLTLAGDTYSNISGYSSPTAGATTYDTTNKQLLTYSNGKWQADRTDAIVVAASNSTQAYKNAADYVATGTNDGTTINTALTAGTGGKVFLLPGTYTLGATSVSVPNNTTLAGSGNGTLLTYPNSLGSSTYYAVRNASTGAGTGVVVRDLKIDGNKAGQSQGAFNGVYFSGMGATGTYRAGGSILNITVTNLFGSVAAGLYISGSHNNTISGNTVNGNSYYGIYLDGSTTNTVNNNQATNNGTQGLALFSSSNGNTITGNTLNSNSSYGIYITSSSNNTVTANVTNSNISGIYLNTATNNVISSNTTNSNSSYGIGLLTTSTGNTISSNRLHDNGSTGSGSGIHFTSSSSNQITGNQITDTAGTSYAINISNAGSSSNYLSDNTFSGTGATTINDAGTNTIYAGQMKSTTDAFTFRGSSDTATAFAIQNASGTGIVGVDTTGSGRLQANNIDAISAGALTLGTTTATSISLAQNTSLASGKTFTVQGNTAVTTTSTTALVIQDAGNARILGVDTSAGTTLFGASNSKTAKLIMYYGSNTNTVTLQTGATSASYVLTLPTALGATGDCLKDTGSGALGFASCGGGGASAKTITLAPEYAGAILRADGSSNNGTMVTDFASGLSAPQGYKHNFYQWTTSQGTTQDYNIVVTHQLPSDFNATTEFDASTWKVWTYVDSTADAALTMTVYDNDMTACASAVSIESGSTGWQQITLSDFDTTGSCDFTANSIITIDVALSSKSPSSNKVRIGEIQYGYTN